MKEEALKLADFIEKHMVDFGLILGEVSRDHIVKTIRKLVAELDERTQENTDLRVLIAVKFSELDKLKGDGEVCGGCGAIRYDPICEPPQTKPLSDEEIEVFKEIIRISDRKHDLWDKAKVILERHWIK